MHYRIYLLFFIVFLVGCTGKPPSNIKITSDLLNGAWYLDSISVGDEQENLFFDNGKMYRCTFYRDGYFIDSATFDNATVNSYSDKVYQLQLLDTNTLLIKSRIEYYYKRKRDDDIKASIETYRMGDLFRKDYIGFWKPVNQVPTPVKILNTSPVCKSVSFEIFNDGSAEFYINQNKDSAVYHSFRVRDSLPQFINGCLAGDYGATWNKSKTQLGMVFSLPYDDTIWFEKVRR